jgi:uncharacterized iron-regulated membrane protein
MSSSPNPTVAPVKSKNWLLVKSRQLHTWGGLIAAAFLLVVGATGILLNYEKPIFRALGIQKDVPPSPYARPPGAKPTKSRLTTATGLSAATVSAEQAVVLARATWGQAELERIELKAEQGELVWKLKARTGDELVINATTGTHFVKGEYERLGKLGADGQPVRSFDWGKLAIDLHTGKIGGEIGKAIMTAAAAVLLFLTVSGIYLYAKPVLIRRTNARARAAQSVPVPLPSTSRPAPRPGAARVETV